MTAATETDPLAQRPARLGTAVGTDAPPRICVGIATRGRPQQVCSVVDHLRGQTLQPDTVIVSCVTRDDVGDLEADDRVRIVQGPPGLARQRNAVFDNLAVGTDFIAFFDDDFYPHDGWLQAVVQAFDNDPQVACVTGNVAADGICGPGLAYEDAICVLENASPKSQSWVIEGYSPYGCNMAFRRSLIDGLRFDERLVLYGWLEDRDFGARIGKTRGRLIKLGAAVGVHLGIKKGRTSGRRLGFSQVMNPYYMHRKQTMTRRGAAHQVLRNLSANAAKSLWPEPYIDRRGRLLGNMIALGDILVGRCNPERAERL